jgi:hypothetical protein
MGQIQGKQNCWKFYELQNGLEDFTGVELVVDGMGIPEAGFAVISDDNYNIEHTSPELLDKILNATS